MGTNFYLKPNNNDPFNDREDFHLGKRSAAGPYCWKCKTTLAVGGSNAVHQGGSWHDECPKCGGKKVKESLENSSAGKELGFNDKELERTGIRSVCSFSFQESEDAVRARLKGAEGTISVIDEYGREMTPEAFLELLEDCPIRFEVSGYFS